MYVNFNALPDQARLWIYQANRKFEPAEEKMIGEEAKAFCDQWVAHGNTLKTSYRIEHHQFLILSVDEGFNGASGCSIDGSVKMLKSLMERLHIDFFDRLNVAFLVDEEVKLVEVAELKNVFERGLLGPGSLTFNLQADSKGTWENNWIVRAEKTWLSRYLPKTPVAS